MTSGQKNENPIKLLLEPLGQQAAVRRTKGRMTGSPFRGGRHCWVSSRPSLAPAAPLVVPEPLLNSISEHRRGKRRSQEADV